MTIGDVIFKIKPISNPTKEPRVPGINLILPILKIVQKDLII